jgi:hypothetical protein
MAVHILQAILGTIRIEITCFRTLDCFLLMYVYMIDYADKIAIINICHSLWLHTVHIALFLPMCSFALHASLSKQSLRHVD